MRKVYAITERVRACSSIFEQLLSALGYHSSMLVPQRHSVILDMVREQGGASVSELAAHLGVSPSTIRRDLNRLDGQGRLQRVRGGGAVEADEKPFSRVAAHMAREKERVGARAARMVADRDVVLLDIGTTCAAVARHLRGRDVAVVTASLAVVDELRDDSAVELIVLGGLLRPSYLSLVGALPLQAIAQLSADIAFIGTSGVRPDGTVLDSTGAEVPIKQAIAASSERTCLVATADKFPGSGLLPVCAVGDLQAVVTSADPGIDPLPALEGGATEVLFA